MDNNTNNPTSQSELTELIDVYALEKMLDSFSSLTGMCVQAVDNNGSVIIKCGERIGICRSCDSADMGCCMNRSKLYSGSQESGLFHCPEGLTVFNAPLKMNGQSLGNVISGCIFDTPDESPSIHTRHFSSNDPAAELSDNPCMDTDTIKKSADALNSVALGLSVIAGSTYQLEMISREAENASKVKSDFLANMSHEIRTPMNAVLGMVDLALREEMPREAREYVSQIKVAGKNLLVIINDILDFSKIESGKMEIIPEVYEPFAILTDVANIINTRISDKEIEFTMDISPDIPRKLYGDHFHIHQVFINILNNAVKFTRKGNVSLKLYCENDENDNTMICASISDTGIGIKEEDKNKLFVSFQQVDSRRNRNIEGTGLGLAITQRLLSMMDGTISFESEYKKGTTFNICIPQRLIEKMPPLPPVAKGLTAHICLEDPYVRKQLCRDLDRVGIAYKEVEDCSALETDCPDYLFMDKNELTDEIVLFYEKNPALRCLAVTEFSSKSSSLLPNVTIIRKPIYSLMLYNSMKLCDIELYSDSTEAEEFNFVAPTANVLIVDDNAVNLTVAKGLLEPLKMNVELAGNAGEAIEHIMEKEYDVIFMDHMMPEVDGIEATHMIRRIMPEYDNIPIIALTANAVNGAKEMFIAEGMADFVAKPIDIKDISAKLHKWLPKDKIVPVDEDDESFIKAPNPDIFIPGIDTAAAVTGLGSKELYITVLNEYYKAIDSKSQIIKKYFDENDIHNYTIEVHSLKSTSRQIGAADLGELAAELEAAGKHNDTALIKEKTGRMLEMYLALKETLAPYVTVEEDTTAVAASKEEVLALFDSLEAALESFDILEIDDIVSKLSHIEFENEKHREYLENIKTASELSDIDEIGRITEVWKEEFAAL